MSVKDFIAIENALRPGSNHDDLFYQDLIYDRLMSSSAIWWIQRLLNVEISHADWSHYGGVFIYNEGDYLKPHVDACKHPKSGLTKVATACLYLTPSTLEFWHGEPASYSTPMVYYVRDTIEAKAGDLVLFTNTVYAWHAVPVVTGGQRVVITCSYLAPEGFIHPQYSSIDKQYNNNRTRAYFGRIDGEPFDYDLELLRELRASESHHEEVYRV